MAGRKTPKHDTWMPFYVADYLADTPHLDTEQHGAYLLLLLAAWKSDGKLSSNSRTLRQITRMSARQWARAEPVLANFFIVTENFWIHDRVRTELDKAKELVDKKASAGASGAARKWGLDRDDSQMTRSARLARARMLGTHDKDEWAAMVEACRYLCVRCGSKPDPCPVKDHIKPIYQGGSDEIENLQPLCRTCNSAKGPDTTDHRPPDWRERLTECLARRLANARPNA